MAPRMRLGAETPGRSGLIGKVRYAAHREFRKGVIPMNGKTSFKQKIRQVKGKKGFTLVELVIVIAVLAIIAFIAIPTVSHVIENANTSADMSNAQAIETAIKSAQAECAANKTTPSDRADTVITGTKQLKTILVAYGVNSDVITSPKVSNDKFYYSKTSGKVIASTSAPTDSDYAVITDTTPYTSDATTKGASATILITPTTTPTPNPGT